MAWPTYRVDAETFALLQDGMSERDVEDILGGPADSRVEVACFSLSGCRQGIQSDWIGEENNIQMTFVENEGSGRRLRPAERISFLARLWRTLLWRLSRIA